MDEYSPPEFPRRNRNPALHDKLVSTLLRTLVKLQEETDPDSGDTSAAGKDFKAFLALQTAGWLIEALAGWALDHQVGLALKGLRFVPAQPSGTNQHPEYLTMRAAVDSHEHEKNGGSLRRDEELDPVVARRLLIELLRSNPGGFHAALQSIAIPSLEALDYGEVMPMMERSRDGSKAGLQEQRLQLQAIGFVEYRYARGMRKYKARNEVAEAFRVDADTIHSWESRLRSKLGQLEVSRTISFAKNAASNSLEAQRRRFDGDQYIHDSANGTYGRLALERAAKHYRRVRQSQSSTQRP